MLIAAQELQLLHLPSASCTDEVLRSLNSDEDRGYRDCLLSLLPALYREVPEQSARILNVVEDYLSDEKQQPSVRLAAGYALAEIGASSSPDGIRRAMLAETDPTMRSSFEDDMKILGAKK